MSNNGEHYRRCECNAKTHWTSWEDGQCPYCGMAVSFQPTGHGHGGFNKVDSELIKKVRRIFGLQSFEESHSLLGPNQLKRIPREERVRIIAIIKRDMSRKNLMLTKR